MHKHISISQGPNFEGCLDVKVDHNSSSKGQSKPKQCSVDVVHIYQAGFYEVVDWFLVFITEKVD